MERVIVDTAVISAEARELWRHVYATKLNGVGYSVTFTAEQHQMAKDNADMAYESYVRAFGQPRVVAVKTGT
jgi:hypothetical protein